MVLDTDIPAGVWPVMLTPFTRDNQVDRQALNELIEWYIENGSAGLFTVCGSSEMFRLNEDERLKMARWVVARAKGRAAVVAAGTFGVNLAEQIESVKKTADTGVRAVVCLVNQLARQEHSDEVWRKNMQQLLDATGDIPLGLYECPSPYHRLLSPEMLRFCAETGRFVFLKETSEDIDAIRQKIAAVAGCGLRFFNAHAATGLASFRAGGNGFCGVSANFYPQLWAWLWDNYRNHPYQAKKLQEFFTETEEFIIRKYPASAKQFLRLVGLDIQTVCRICDCSFSDNEIEQYQKLQTKIYELSASI